MTCEESGDASLRPAVASEAPSSEPYKPAFYIALDRIVYDSLRPVSAALAILFTFLAVSHAILLPKGVAVPMTLVASFSACVVGGLYYVLGRQQLPLRYAHPLGICIFALALLNSVIHLGLTFEARQSTNFALLTIGAGCFFLRRRWFALAVLSALASWMCVVSFAPASAEWLHFGFMLLIAAVLSALVYTVRFRLFCRIEESRAEDERRRQTLEASEEKFRAVSENANDAVVSADGRGRIIYWNKSAERIFGYSPHEVLGEPITVLMPERFHASHERGMARYLSIGEVHVIGKTVEMAGRRKDGSEFPLDLSLSKWKTREGTFFTGAIWDITERKQFEQAVQDKNIELEKANLAKDRFLASMSHELRTPLNAIIGFTGTLLMRLPGSLTDEQSKQLGTIRSSAKHLLSLINDLLDLAKIGSGKVALALEPLVLQSVVEDVLTTLLPSAEAKGLELKVIVPEGELVLTTDRRALSQILFNLVSNAIKFTERGEVCIVLARESVNGKTWTQLSVHDTGIGIRPEDQPKLFQPFSQVERIGPRRHEGTGLGLQVSQKLAELLGGQINFKSEYGKGSTFTLSLPES